MDAAYYITTLEEMSPKSDKPQVASYAIIDLAIAHDFLKQLYNVMANETVACGVCLKAVNGNQIGLVVQSWWTCETAIRLHSSLRKTWRPAPWVS